jgi:hypothetical protein
MGLPFCLFTGHPKSSGEFINHHKSDIMASGSVLQTGIPQTNHQKQIIIHSSPPPRHQAHKKIRKEQAPLPDE